MFEPIIFNNPIIHILSHALGADAQLHLVGGAVRDLLLSRFSPQNHIEPKDFDFATVLWPEEVCRRLTQHNIKWIATGIRRGTITALINNEPVEITTFRNYKNENTFTETIEEDLSARDFTINAIAINVLNKNMVIDPFNGIADLKNHIIRAVGNPQDRFAEDAHRIIRLVRFSFHAGINWKIEEETERQARLCVPLIEGIAQERIHDELIKILLLTDVREAFNRIKRLGILAIILPELECAVNVSQNSHHIFDVFEHSLACVENAPQEIVVRLAGLLHDIGKPHCITTDENGIRHFIGHEDISAEIARNVLERLRFSAAITDEVCLLIQHHMKPITCGNAGVRRLLHALGDSFPKWLELKWADLRAGHIISEVKFAAEWGAFQSLLAAEQSREQKKSCFELAIRGRDLIELGLKPGPKFGQILRHLQERVIENPELNENEILINLAQNFLKGI